MIETGIVILLPQSAGGCYAPGDSMDQPIANVPVLGKNGMWHCDLLIDSALYLFD